MELHSIEPIYDENSKILILGSFPSVKSREERFFYAHPQNRFWKVLARAFGAQLPQSIEEKKRFLLSNRIALWDVIASCDIEGSSDVTIKNATANDLSRITSVAKIEKIILNGKTAEKYFNRFLRKNININAISLPSTSPANAAWSIENLTRVWSENIFS